jgi:sigma-B regulation protein RsbU (phosphoserine phosphatase)
MKSISNTNVSFNFLKNSGEFMHLVLNNINSCVLLLDKQMQLRAFNDALKTIFSNRKDEHLLYIRCGEAIGCAYQIDEAKNCGETSKCCNCDLRLAAMQSYLNNDVVYKEHIVRPFYTYDGIKVDKHLQFSTRIFPFNRDKYIVMIVEDISKFYD